MHKVVILGCGWLGQQLANAMTDAGYQVFGTRQSLQGCQELTGAIQPVMLQLPAAEFPIDLVADAIVIVALPASTPNYLLALKQISQACEQATQIFFCSSTGIYAGKSGHLTETALLTADDVGAAVSDELLALAAVDLRMALQLAAHPELSQQFNRVQRLMAAEIIMLQQAKVVVLRLAGLIGPGRHPANFCRQGSLAGADLPVNMVHSLDIQQFLLIWLQQPQTAAKLGNVFNLCCPEHPSKRDFYQQACADAQVHVPNFIIESREGGAELPRTIDVSRSLRLPGFSYQFFSPISAIAHCSS